jgi:DnaJ-class molecular chaperone
MRAGSKPRVRRCFSTVHRSGAVMTTIKSDKTAPGDQARPGTQQSAENICPKCAGSGRVDEKPCGNCGGTGKVIEIVGDA